jgi:hypothetical protein
LVFTGSSDRSSLARTALKAAAEGAAVGLVGIGAACAVFSAAPQRKGIALGVVAAWLASSASVGWLLWARRVSMRAFWWAFGGGMALRAAALAGLMAWSWRRAGLAQDALLVSYVFGLLAMLLTLESRYLKLS